MTANSKSMIHRVRGAVRILPLSVLCILFSMGSSAAGQFEDALFNELEHHVPELASSSWYGEALAVEEQWLFEVYRENGFQPIWFSDTALGEAAMVLLDTLENADQHGLAPQDYNLESITALLDRASPAERARLDLALTDGFLRYVHDLSEGQSKARHAFPELFSEAGSPAFSPLEAIRFADHPGGLQGNLSSLAPQHRYYRQLTEALAEYRKIAQLGGWPSIKDGPTLHPGESDPRVAPLRDLLITTGDLEQDSDQGDLYDSETAAAVKRYQQRHGLSDDGVIGPKTLAAMNVSVAERIEQLKLNLERWRWHDRELGDTYVLVNIAGFDLKAVRGNSLELEMRVIVGKLHHETPVFSDRIRYAEFNPYWNLTPHIARTETLSHLRKNPGYLAEKHIRLFSSWGGDAVELDPLTIDWQSVTPRAMNRYKLRQDPGVWNALGTMKFIFPNKYSVYLHDTPNHDLFRTANRAFSHGCIRLSDPHAMAVFLLDQGDGSWNRQRVEAIVDSAERTIVNLPERIPVHLTYLTAWHDEEGVLHFNEDLYGRDKRLLKALNSGN